MAAGGGSVLSEASADMFEPGDSGGSGWGTAEPRSLLLAAKHRDSRSCEEGERSSYLGGAAADGGTDRWRYWAWRN